MIKKIETAQPICSCSGKKFDEEHKRIMRRLYMVYGIRPTGNKSKDRALLYTKEKEDAERINYITTEFITVSREEQEKIQEKKKKKKFDSDKTSQFDTIQAQIALGEQKMLAIQMQKMKSNLL